MPHSHLWLGEDLVCLLACLQFGETYSLRESFALVLGSRMSQVVAMFGYGCVCLGLCSIDKQVDFAWASGLGIRRG